MSVRLDGVLPVIFFPMVDMPNQNSLHAEFNRKLCALKPEERGIQLRKHRAFWQMRIACDDQSLGSEAPVHLDVH